MTRRVGSSRSTGPRSTIRKSSRTRGRCGSARTTRRSHNSKVVGVLDDGGAKPWVCFDGRLPKSEWRDPVNVSFARPPITYDEAAAAAKTTTTTTKTTTTMRSSRVGSSSPTRSRECSTAFGAQAYASAAVYYELRVKQGWSTPLAAIVAVLVVSPLLGVVVYFGLRCSRCTRRRGRTPCEPRPAQFASR